MKTRKYVRPEDLEQAVTEALQGTEPRRGTERTRTFTGLYPKEVAQLVAHKRKADSTLTETDALCQVFSERPDLYEQYDRERMLHPAPEPVRMSEPERPAGLKAAESAFAKELAVYCTARHLDPDDPATTGKFCRTPRGAALYDEIDQARRDWLGMGDGDDDGDGDK